MRKSPTEVARDSDAQATWRALYPFDSHWLEVAGRRMHFLDERPVKRPAGEMATLLFVHGNPTWSFHWRNLIIGLRSDYRCVAPDHIGCGLSEKDGPSLRLADRIGHLITLIDGLSLRRITLVAQDWGGAIGLGAVLRRPQHFERIVLFNTGAFPPPFVPWRIRVCRLPLVGRLAVQGGNLFSRAALSMAIAGKARLPAPVASGYLAPYDSWLHRRAVYTFVKDIPTSPRHPTWQTLAHLETRLPLLATKPVCLIWGMQDWCFRPQCLDRLFAIWPHAQIHRVQDAGHWVVEDAAHEALGHLEAFLRATGTGVSTEVSHADNPRMPAT